MNGRGRQRSYFQYLTSLLLHNLPRLMVLTKSFCLSLKICHSPPRVDPNTFKMSDKLVIGFCCNNSLKVFSLATLLSQPDSFNCSQSENCNLLTK